MISAHLLTSSLLLASLTALAQDKTAISPDSDSIQITDAQKTGQSVAKEPWDIFAKPFRLDSGVGRLLAPPNGQLGDETLCYTMRSYVVARDSKDSDSVHPTGYSTCQPASRYRLRTTQLRASPGK